MDRAINDVQMIHVVSRLKDRNRSRNVKSTTDFRIFFFFYYERMKLNLFLFVSSRSIPLKMCAILCLRESWNVRKIIKLY